METAPLKSFATWARTTLIREVTARIAVVLAPASPERVEQPKAVEDLEKAVTAVGGGENGKAAVADRVAYTWFNRIVALRFMDANGYTGIGVVSPQPGVETGQPEILAEAKRGNIDAAVVSTKTRDTVTALLNGTRRSDDTQGEAYALLLADYCRYWNRAMPFMFEREGDYTELLIPANLLADESVPSRAVKVLTKDVCQDVEVIGWLYQFYISERKDDVFASFKKNKKAGADEIPAATQLFTPHWIVRYLVENSLGRLWMLNRPTSRLVDQMQYYIAPIDDETDFLKISRPDELKVVDPACGSGHMLTYAFDLLYSIYEEEGYAPAEIPSLILANNLFGVEIDPRAGALAAFALTMKARSKQRTFFNKQVDPNVCVLDPIRFTPDEIEFLFTRGGDKHEETAFWNQFEDADIFGSLIQPDTELTARVACHFESLDDEGDMLKADIASRAARVLTQARYLTERYSVVVANPPYMGSKNMDVRLAEFTKATYPSGKQDLYGCFVLRAMNLACPNGFVAEVIGDTWMSIVSFETLRKHILTGHSFDSFIHLRDVSNHPDIFGANAAFVLSMAGAQGRMTPFVQLTTLAVEEKRQALLRAIAEPTCGWRFSASSNDFAKVPGSPIAYWLSDAKRAVFDLPESLGRFVETEGQNKTANNDLYLRFHWEVSRRDCRRDKWIPYAKGGTFRRWFGNVENVVNWTPAARSEYRRNSSCRIIAEEFWYRQGISWTDITSSGTGFRFLPEGGTFDMAGPTAFIAPELSLETVLGFLNSSLVESLLPVLNPTLHLQLRDVKALPFSKSLLDIAWLSPNVTAAVACSRSDWDSFETAWDFRISPLVALAIATEASEADVSASRIAPEFGGTDGSRGRPAGVVATLEDIVSAYSAESATAAARQQSLEVENNRVVAEAYGLEDEVQIQVPLHRVSLTRNVEYRYGPGKSPQEYFALEWTDLVVDLVSYAVGCMFGRYSLDKEGLILADQGATLQDYFDAVPSTTFAPDADNVIPIVDGDWFADDIVARFRAFLRSAFGERNFEENLAFVTESLGVKGIRDYFVRSFYKDHVQRYKKRPIYWLFSSPNGSFNALIYMHRYTPSTVSTVLNEYLREYRAKLASSLQQQELLAARGGSPRQQAAAQKEADRLRKVLLELDEYEHDVLYPLASRQLAIDLDDGVKANYPKFGGALKKIPGLGGSNE
ncbi:BREX-1 system adenine-specific DNA-methyltransferase PglX [Amycolatopsis sp. NPDC005003]